MPTNRRRRMRHLSPGAVTALNPRRRDYLVCGVDFFGAASRGDPLFDDDRQAQLCWAVHREEILAGWNAIGRRPWSLWAFDYGLEQVGYPREWLWPDDIESESEMVRALLLAGELEPCRRDGTRPVADEVAAIEAKWRHELRFTIAGLEECVPARGPLPTFGTPIWFVRAHARRVLAEQLAERERYYAKMDREPLL